MRAAALTWKRACAELKDEAPRCALPVLMGLLLCVVSVCQHVLSDFSLVSFL